jgi:hypothetical protein
MMSKVAEKTSHNFYRIGDSGMLFALCTPFISIKPEITQSIIQNCGQTHANKTNHSDLSRFLALPQRGIQWKSSNTEAPHGFSFQKRCRPGVAKNHTTCQRKK